MFSLDNQLLILWELVKMQILTRHPRPTESETPGLGLGICVLASPPGDSVHAKV